jgi:hypothetical protein
MNVPARLHNNPPDPIDTALEPFGDTITEAESWLDGSPVENEGQMTAVDALIKGMKSAKKAVEAADESATKPMYDAWKAEKARYKPTLDDLDRIIKGLVAAVDTFKRKLAAEKEVARKEAERLAWEATRAAEKAAREADASNIEATRAAAQAMADAEAAQRASMAANKDTVKGLRTYTFRTVDDPLIFGRWVWSNDRPAFESFLQSYADKMPGKPPAGCGATERTENRAV